MNDLHSKNNIAQFSSNLSHVFNINNHPFEEDDLKFDIKISDGYLYFNNMQCGCVSSELKLSVTGQIDKDRVERIIELSTSCQHSEFNSSSPSMILHQIAVLTFLDIMPGRKSIEEFKFERRNDLIWHHLNRTIVIEMTGDTYKSRFNRMKSKMTRDFIVINKYVFNPLTKDVDDIKILSRENDSRSIEQIYRKSVQQSNSVGKEMLYNRNILKFFIEIPKIHVKACEDAHVRYCREAVDGIKKSEDPSPDYVSKCISELHHGLLELQTKEMSDSNFYSFDLNIYRGFDYDLSNEVLTKDNQTKATCEDGNLEFQSPDESAVGHKLYTLVDTCSLVTGAYLSVINYPETKTIREDYISNHISEIIDRFHSVTNLFQLINGMCLRMYGAPITDYKSKKRRIHRKIRPQIQHKSKINVSDMSMMYLSTYDVIMDIDPDHLSILKVEGIPSYITEIFSNSRDVFELRMKKRIAMSALKVRKSMKPFRVHHWKDKSIFADCIIMGKLFQKDTGVMYVSYYTDYRLSATQKWRLPDVENYSVGPERALALAASIGKRGFTYLTSKKSLTLYFRLLNENSWGVSKFLKPYRYFSSGIAMGSSRTHDQIPKILSEANSYLSDKLSIRYLTHLLGKSDCCPGRTPALDLGFEDIGYECFLLNLCPSKTYGSSRHLVNVLTELSEEIKLYNDNFDTTKEIFRDFNSIISSKSLDRRYLSDMYYDHLKLIDRCSLLNNGRFTFSPSALIICKRELDSLNLRPELSRPPSIDELTTARGSTSNFTGEPRMALESINELSRKMNSGSTTRLALRLVKSPPVDLTMRMFDKDQVGGDREISILNSGFRILQAVSESFFKSLGSQSGVDLLADKHKTLNYTKSISECLSSKVSRLLTIDQTRWGPNFNTITFGLLSLMTSHLSTEYYMSSLICLLSEFKVFEMPILEPQLSNLQEISYSLPGLVGRSHMGQGIFHYASSFYHSLTLLSIKRLFYKSYKLSPRECLIRTFCTSDDASIVAYNSASCTQSRESYVSEKIKFLYSFFERVIHLYGIKTNKTKNIDSPNTIEFNSMYYSRNGIGSNDIKFLYSLIDPMTTGNLYRDSNMVYMVFDRAVNSGCTIENAVIISKCVFLIKLRQWKSRGNIVRPPSYELICTGSDILEPYDPDSTDSLYFSTGLNFSRKRRIREEFHRSDDSYVLTKLKQESNLESMLNSRVSEKFRSMQTYNNVGKIGIPISSIFRSLAPTSITMSNEFFMREFFSSGEFIRILKGREQKMSNTLYQKCWTRPTLFTFKILKQRRMNDFDTMSYLVSLSDPVLTLENLDNQEEFLLHLFRKRTRYDLEDELIREFSGFNLDEKIKRLTKLRIELEMSSPNVVQLVHNPLRKSLEYTRQLRNWSRSASVLSRVVKLMCVTNLSKLKHSVCYTNTEAITAYYTRYDLGKGEFTEFIPSSLSEWPQVSVTENILKLSDIKLNERILRDLCSREMTFRESRRDVPYLIVRKRIDSPPSVDASQSQFTFDFNSDDHDPVSDEYCSIRLDTRYSYLATSYVLKQSMILSTIEYLSSKGACLYKDIESLISGKHTMTYFTRGLMRDLDWMVTERMTTMSNDLTNVEESSNFLFDIYFNVFETENLEYYPIYAMLNVTHPHYVSFRPRGKIICKDEFRDIVRSMITDTTVINPDSDIIERDYPVENESLIDDNLTITSYEKSEYENSNSGSEQDYYNDIGESLEPDLLNIGASLGDIIGDSSDFRDNIEEIMNVIHLKLGDDSSSDSDASY